MGLIPGLMAAGIASYKAKGTIIKAEILVVIATAIGMLVPSLLEIPLSGIDLRTAIVGYWFPRSTKQHGINGLILVPILVVAYDAVVSRSGRWREPIGPALLVSGGPALAGETLC